MPDTVRDNTLPKIKKYTYYTHSQTHHDWEQWVRKIQREERGSERKNKWKYSVELESWSHSIRLHQPSLGKSDKCFERTKEKNEVYRRKMSNFSFEQNAWYHYPWHSNNTALTREWLQFIIFSMHISTVRIVAMCIFILFLIFCSSSTLIAFYPDELFDFSSPSLYIRVFAICSGGKSAYWIENTNDIKSRSNFMWTRHIAFNVNIFICCIKE